MRSRRPGRGGPGPVPAGRPSDRRAPARAESALVAARAAGDPASRWRPSRRSPSSTRSTVTGRRRRPARRRPAAGPRGGRAGRELRAHYSLASLHYYNGDIAASLPVLRTAMARVTESGLRWSEPGRRAQAAARRRAVRRGRPRGQPAARRDAREPATRRRGRPAGRGELLRRRRGRLPRRTHVQEVRQLGFMCGIELPPIRRGTPPTSRPRGSAIRSRSRRAHAEQSSARSATSSS